MEKMDKDTANLFREQQQIYEWVKDEKWQMIKMILMGKLASVIDITTYDLTQGPENMLIDLKANKKVVEIIKDWISEIEGVKEQYEQNRDIFQPTKEDIIHYT